DPERGRFWQLGIVLAAQALGLDLDHPVIRPGEIILRGPKGVERRIPVGQDGLFYVDWSLKWDDSRIQTNDVFDLLVERELRGSGTKIEPAWRNKIVVVGSIGIGNNITDVGATPLTNRTFLVSAHWNIANSVIMGRFVRKSSYLTEMLLILLMSAIATYLSWRFRALAGTFSILAVAGLYTAAAVSLYVQNLYWLPVVLPVAGTLMITYSGMVCYRVIIERYVRASFAGTFSPEVVELLSEGRTAPLVAPLLGLPPNVITSLLAKDTLTVGGSRRRLTVYFADLRGFTELTETSRTRTEDYLQKHALSDKAAEEIIDREARELLTTVNLYLSTIVDAITAHDGTLDKYIGDCVMAFWGAPSPNPQHALACVRGAIAAQRAVMALNQERDRQNRQLEQESADRARTGLPPPPLLPMLRVGSGISTGTLTVGFMGSPAHVSNYTVFGREVAIASRLEGISGHSRIIISESTYAELRRDDPQLAAACRELPPVTVKGIHTPLQIYEVPWEPPAGPAAVVR
ncbi:MAG: adenylate/guanylate cyclase domain-containing protein, partial [Limisphaerales bacterium]